MALLTKISTAMRNAAADGMADLFDGGTPPSVIRIRDGAQETNVSDVSTGNLLGTVTMPNPAFGGASAGAVAAGTMINDSSADLTGTAGHARCYQGGAADTAALMQVNAGNAADAVNMTFDNKSIVAGGVIAVTSFTITVPVS